MTATSTEKKENLTPDQLVAIYMDYVLENEKTPSSVYKFCKEVEINEEEFYKISGSFESLQQQVWNSFFTNTVEVMQKDEHYDGFTHRNKVLTLFFTFFEILTLNRSYVLFSLKEHKNVLKNLDQLKGLRRYMKAFAKELVDDQGTNASKKIKFLKKSPEIFSEGIWMQYLFLLKFWMDDSSAGFEKTDIAVEKSVNTFFDVFDNTPLNSVVDFGKFLWKEKIA
ncbi:TetR/AcrR family transcriptional regulator [Flavobacteriaceae bacterium R38]|nr:TetR/AcrR family transcriptional regulator [Flavobacteriaceae bacterium R38]